MNFFSQMVEESTRLQDIRLERLQDLQTRHVKELREFDTVSRRHVEGSPRSSRHSYTSGYSSGGSPRSSRAFNQGSPRHSNRSLGTPASRFPLQQQQPNRESSVSMTSLQSTGYGEQHSYSGPPMYNASSVSNMTSRSNSSSRHSSDSRNGNAGDRLSYHGPPSNPRR